MSNRRSGGGGGGGGGRGSADEIPDDVRKTIQNIREITSKQHSDEDIYTLLKECSLDADDAVQKLLYLDTFHEVKKKRDRKKETSPKQGHRARGGRGNYSAHYVSPDAFGGKRAATQRENGGNHVIERISSNSLPAAQRTNKNATIPVTKASGISNGSSGLGNGSGPQLPVNCAVDGTKHHPTADMMKSGTGALLPRPPASASNWTFGSLIQPQESRSTSSSSDQNSPIPTALSGVSSPASDPILAPSMVRNSVAVGTIKHEVRSQRKAPESNHTQGPKQSSDEDMLELPKDESECLEIPSHANRKNASGRSKPAEKNQMYKSMHPSSLSSNDGPLLTRSYDSYSPEDSILPAKVESSEDAQAKANSQLLPGQSGTSGLVTFPNHFKVPEALGTVLTFGSFTPKISGVKNGNASDVNPSHAIDSSLGTDETAGELASSDGRITSNGQVDHVDKPESPKQLLDEVQQSDGNDASYADSEDDNVKKDVISLQEGHQNASTQIAPTYGFGIVQPVHGGNRAQFDGHEAQAPDISRVSSFVSENPSASPSPSPTPPVQNSVAAPLQPFLFRPPYPPNFFLYWPYVNPYLVPPMHHFLSHDGLPSTGNAYLTPAATGPTAKFPVPQLKPGTSPGNPTLIGLSPLYGSYGSSPIGISPGPAVTSGSSAGKEDILASQLKENGIFTTGPASEVSAWFPSPGQDISSMQLNPLCHIPAQGQHLNFSHAQAGHGPFTGVYPPLHTITTSTANPILQQPQTISNVVETVGLPSGA